MLAAMLCAGRAWAHVGSPDVYVRGDAGPYTVYVSVHPPAMVPGAAEIDVRSADAAVTGVAVAAEGASEQALQRFAEEKKFVGSAWIPAGARVWKLRVQVTGAQGEGEMTVPVTLPAVVQTRWQWVWPWIFGVEGLVLLVGGFIGRRRRNNALRVRAATLVLKPTRAPGLSQALAFILMGCGVVGLAACVWSARHISQRTLTPAMQIEINDGVMRLKLSRVSGGHALDDLAPDHGHVMHLFLVRLPAMDVVLHLHPTAVSAGKDAAEFTETMPPMADGTFALYADVTHSDGVAETATMTAGLPMSVGHALTGDDSVGVVGRNVGAGCGAVSTMVDGYRMTLQCEGALKAKTGMLLRVTLVDAAGNAPADMENYMGMGGHAAVVAADGSVFAHIHPMGTVMVASAMDGMAMPVSNVVEFPYGFPKAGGYRVFVQMKHSNVVETGAFDLVVE
jgi:hypothetical protein